MHLSAQVLPILVVVVTMGGKAALEVASIAAMAGLRCVCSPLTGEPMHDIICKLCEGQVLEQSKVALQRGASSCV